VEAEKIGSGEKDCAAKYGEKCPHGVLDTFTKIKVN
jgi:hypothetical protein